jgi:hypothetical protein
MAAKSATERKPAKAAATVRIRWAGRNRILVGAGLAAVILGYVLLSQGDITLAPVLLVAGYCVLIPLAFIL